MATMTTIQRGTAKNLEMSTRVLIQKKILSRTLLQDLLRLKIKISQT